MDESQLVVKAREGDESAFSLLAKRYGNFVLALASYYVGAGDSHDAAQEIWLAVFRKLWQLEDPLRFVPWLKKLVFYQCVNYRKARSRRTMYEMVWSQNSSRRVASCKLEGGFSNSEKPPFSCAGNLWVI